MAHQIINTHLQTNAKIAENTSAEKVLKQLNQQFQQKSRTLDQKILKKIIIFEDIPYFYNKQFCIT